VDHTLIAQAGAAAATSGITGDTLIKAASLIGAGLAAVGVAGPGVGIGVAGARALEGMARQPEMTQKLLINWIIITAFMEAMGLFALAVSFMLIFYNPAQGH
jgi:F-type H+-transporting ATPase subunit c